MPAVVKSTLGSSFGIKEAFGISLWFFDLKKSMYFWMSCVLVIFSFTILYAVAYLHKPKAAAP